MLKLWSFLYKIPYNKCICNYTNFLDIPPYHNLKLNQRTNSFVSPNLNSLQFVYTIKTIKIKSSFQTRFHPKAKKWINPSLLRCLTSKSAFLQLFPLTQTTVSTNCTWKSGLCSAGSVYQVQQHGACLGLLGRLWGEQHLSPGDPSQPGWHKTCHLKDKASSHNASHTAVSRHQCHTVSHLSIPSACLSSCVHCSPCSITQPCFFT